MNEILTTCPICDGGLNISAFTCSDCGLTLQKNFKLNRFNYLTNEEMRFLCSFLVNQGNFSMVQAELELTYIQAKKTMQNLLQVLELSPNHSDANQINLSKLEFEENSTLASDIVKKALYSNGGKLTVESLQKKTYEIIAQDDGERFYCSQLPFQPEYTIFNLMVECIDKNGGSARKGNSRNYKMGDPVCDDSTLVGYLGKHYFGKTDGESTLDPIFILASILNHVGVAENCLGYVKLKEDTI